MANRMTMSGAVRLIPWLKPAGLLLPDCLSSLPGALQRYVRAAVAAGAPPADSVAADSAFAIGGRRATIGRGWNEKEGLSRRGAPALRWRVFVAVTAAVEAEAWAAPMLQGGPASRTTRPEGLRPECVCA